MKRKVLSLMLMAAMAVSLVACGNSEKPSTTDTVINTTTNIDDVNTSTDDNVTGITDSQEETTATEETESVEETTTEVTVLKDGPKNPTYRKVYSMPYSAYDYVLNGKYTLDEIIEMGFINSSVYEEKIEYTENGYITTTTYNDIQQGVSIDSVTTYNKRGEIINIKETTFNKDNPDGVVDVDIDFAQNHYCSGVIRGVNCTADIEVDSEGKIVSINKIWREFGTRYDHGCGLVDAGAVLQEDNRTIFYDDATCEVYDVESRENFIVLENGSFEMINYNSDGKIDSISYVSGFKNGKDLEGNTYVSFKEYMDKVINEGKKVDVQVEWLYDKNGNILMIKQKDTYTIYVY